MQKTNIEPRQKRYTTHTTYCGMAHRSRQITVPHRKTIRNVALIRNSIIAAPPARKHVRSPNPRTWGNAYVKGAHRLRKHTSLLNCAMLCFACSTVAWLCPQSTSTITLAVMLRMGEEGSHQPLHQPKRHKMLQSETKRRRVFSECWGGGPGRAGLPVAGRVDGLRVLGCAIL